MTGQSVSMQISEATSGVMVSTSAFLACHHATGDAWCNG